MPVRLLNSSVARWPNRNEVDRALRQWLCNLLNTNQDNIVALGYFGSYARGDAGFGSDLDVVIIVTESDLPFERRASVWDFFSIPVPVEASVYTLTEWQELPEKQPRFYQTLVRETVWLKELPESI